MGSELTSAGRETPDLPPTDILSGYIDEDEYARQRGISLRTAQRDRQLRKSPPYVVMGRQVYYRLESIRAWLLAREREVDLSPAWRRGRRRHAQ
jgi:hypothetical protein